MKIQIREQDFILCAERAIFWTAPKVLLCSDLHWGREAYLQQKGFAVPEHHFEREARELKNLLFDLAAEELWILGDFIHHPEGLHLELIERIRVWMQSLKEETSVKTIRLVPGNHDKRFLEWAKKLPLTVEEYGIQKDDFIFVHDESELHKHEKRYCFSGHLHPAFHPPMLGSAKLPCFWIRANKAYLPAYSRLAGGMEIGRPQEDDRVYVIAENQVIELYV